jgi:predicted deacylase
MNKILLSIGVILSVVFASGCISNTDEEKISVYNWGSQGNIINNILIKNNIPNSQIVNDILDKTKEGTPVVRFGNGIGPIVLVVAGVHGNELSSQVAAMKLINDLNEMDKKEEIIGTVYVIPFVSPKSTAMNERFFNGENLNSIANQKGSITNNILDFCLTMNVEAVGDFHCTQPGGDPGINVIMGAKKPTNGVKEMVVAISKITGLPYMLYDEAGKAYPGALEDNLNMNNIKSITCEVKTPHGEIASGSIDTSYKQMIAFLKYNGNIK